MFNTILQQRSTDNSWAYPGYSAPFGIIVDMQLTVPEAVGSTLYLQRLYQNSNGAVSVVIGDVEGNPIASLIDCNTFDIPVAMDVSWVPGVTAQILLCSGHGEPGELISSPVRIHPALISLNKSEAASYQNLTLVLDGTTIYNEVLTSDVNLEVSNDYSVAVNGGTASISVRNPSAIETFIASAGTSTELLIRTVNNIAPDDNGVVYITLAVNNTQDINIGNTELRVLSGTSDINVVKTAYIDSTEFNDILNPVDLIDKYISPKLPTREYKYLPLDDAYYFAGSTSTGFIGERNTINNLGGTVTTAPDADYDVVQ